MNDLDALFGQRAMTNEELLWMYGNGLQNAYNNPGQLRGMSLENLQPDSLTMALQAFYYQAFNNLSQPVQHRTFGNIFYRGSRYDEKSRQIARHEQLLGR